jgi:hypothetical protein
VDFFEANPPQPIFRSLKVFINHSDDRAEIIRHPLHEPARVPQEWDLVVLDQWCSKHPQPALTKECLTVTTEDGRGPSVNETDKGRKLAPDRALQDLGRVDLQLLNRALFVEPEIRQNLDPIFDRCRLELDHLPVSPT